MWACPTMLECARSCGYLDGLLIINHMALGPKNRRAMDLPLPKKIRFSASGSHTHNFCWLSVFEAPEIYVSILISVAFGLLVANQVISNGMCPTLDPQPHGHSKLSLSGSNTDMICL